MGQQSLQIITYAGIRSTLRGIKGQGEYKLAHVVTPRVHLSTTVRIICRMSETYQSKRELWQRLLEALPVGLREHVSLRNAEAVAALADLLNPPGPADAKDWRKQDA